MAVIQLPPKRSLLRLWFSLVDVLRSGVVLFQTIYRRSAVSILSHGCVYVFIICILHARDHYFIEYVYKTVRGKFRSGVLARVLALAYCVNRGLISMEKNLPRINIYIFLLIRYIFEKKHPW